MTEEAPVRAFDVDGLFPPRNYSHVVVAGPSPLVFVSGQVGARADGLVPSDIIEQSEIVFENLHRALAAAGTGLSAVLKMNTYLDDISHLAAVQAVRGRWLDDAFPNGGYPTSTLVAVAALARPEFLVEVEVVAAGPS